MSQYTEIDREIVDERRSDAVQGITSVLDKFGIDIQPDQFPEVDGVEGISREAYRLETVALEGARYIEAQQAYNEVEELPFGEDEQQVAVEFLLSHDANEVAHAAYDMEQITPEIERYMLAQKLSHEVEDVPFDGQARMEALAALGDTPDEVAYAAAEIERTLPDDVLEMQHDIETTAFISEYTQDFAAYNGGRMPLEDSGCDVVTDGGIKGECLNNAFCKALDHSGDVSLEVMSQQPEIPLAQSEVEVEIPQIYAI